MKWFFYSYKILLIFLVFTISSCEENTYELQSEYNLRYGVTDANAYFIDDGAYERLNSASYENLIDTYIFPSSLGDTSVELEHIIFDKIIFLDETSGNITSGKGISEYSFSYLLIHNILEIEISELSKKITFELTDSGNKIESCDYVVLIRISDKPYFKTLASFSCESLSYRDAANKYLDQNNIVPDTIALVELTHISSL